MSQTRRNKETNKNRLHALLALLLFSQFIYGQQLSPHARAYKIFRTKSPRLKAEYLVSHNMPQKLSDRQNKTYAKLGIRNVIVFKETKGVIDTIAIHKFNSEGYLLEKDTFTWFNKDTKYVQQSVYEYSPKEKKVKETFQAIALPGTVPYQTIKMVRYYDKEGRLFKSEGINGNDTTFMLVELDSNGMIKNNKWYPTRNFLGGEQLNEYEFDKKGRLVSMIQHPTRNYKNYEGRVGEGGGPLYDEILPDTFQLIYNDRERSIRIIRKNECDETYYLNKRSHVFQNHCCPMSTSHLEAGWFSPEITTTLFDRRGRVKSISRAQHIDKTQCGKNGHPFIVKQFKYNRKGLLSEIMVNGNEKISFHYLR